MKDDLYEDAKEFVIKEQTAGVSDVQRKLMIGYNRAHRIVEQLEDEGIVSYPDNRGKRTVLKGDK